MTNQLRRVIDALGPLTKSFQQSDNTLSVTSRDDVLQASRNGFFFIGSDLLVDDSDVGGTDERLGTASEQARSAAFLIKPGDFPIVELTTKESSDKEIKTNLFESPAFDETNASAIDSPLSATNRTEATTPKTSIQRIPFSDVSDFGQLISASTNGGASGDTAFSDQGGAVLNGDMFILDPEKTYLLLAQNLDDNNAASVTARFGISERKII